MRYLGIVRFLHNGEARVGGIRTVIADFPGYYSVFLVRDFKDKVDVVVDSRSAA